MSNEFNKDAVLSLVKRKKFKVGSKAIEIVPDTLKTNPNSLRFLLGLMVNVAFDGNRQKAAEELGKALPVYRKAPNGEDEKKFTNKSLGALLNDDPQITFWHIEVFARHFGIPVGALLLLSRLISHVRDDDEARAEVVISGTMRLVEVLQKVRDTKEVTGQDLIDIADCYPSQVQQDMLRGQ